VSEPGYWMYETSGVLHYPFRFIQADAAPMIQAFFSCSRILLFQTSMERLMAIEFGEVRALYDELLDVTRDWTRHDRTLPNEARVKAIGRELYDLGGESLMQMAYYHATAANPAATVLALLWDGIGEWRW
jgi:hypothetical protein